VIGRPSLKGKLTQVIGNRITPPLAVTGVFTAGFNVGVHIRCAFGDIR
jgi:hypothetical protein